MTKIKLCGLTRPCDIEAANELKSDFVGFVFAPGSRRRVSDEEARALRALLSPAIRAVGVFVREEPDRVAERLNSDLIDAAQLHGGEGEEYVRRLRALTDKPIVQAFRIACPADVDAARRSIADAILLDNGAGGTGTAFDWSMLAGLDRPYFLAGGLGPQNVAAAIEALHPYGVDVSSGIETEGKKDIEKMRSFVRTVRSFG